MKWTPIHAIGTGAVLLLFSCAHSTPSTRASIEASAPARARAAAGGPAVIFRGEASMPRSMIDRGKYYLLRVTRTGSVYETLHKRVGPGYVGYTKCEIDYSRQVMRTIGYSEVSGLEIGYSPSQWFDLVPGSSKSDMYNYVLENVLPAYD